MSEYLVDMRKISKSFGAVTALKDVTLTLPHGSVLGLVGDNAAGKSTLMRTIATLQAAVRTGAFERYQDYARLVNERPVATLRDLFEVTPAGPPIALSEVEPIENILPRFDSAGMSLGALSPEAHEALAIAMNRIGARSNSGEGGEDPSRHGSQRRSKIKQVMQDSSTSKMHR